MQCKSGNYFFQEEYLNNNNGGVNIDRRIELTCGFGGLWDKQSIPKCEPYYCGSLKEVKRGHVKNFNRVTDFSLDSEVEFECFQGFTLEGSKQICRDGGWVGEPKCRAAGCPNLGIISNDGTFKNTTYGEPGDDEYGTVLRYACDDGYEYAATAPPVFACRFKSGSSGVEWTSDPSLAVCNRHYCPIPKFPNATVSDQGAVRYNTEITVTCIEGHVINGTDGSDATTACGSDRKFDKNLFCVDRDECASSNVCDGDKGTCTNTYGSYYCGCKDGYEIDGNICVNIDECKRNPNLCHRSDHSSCTDGHCCKDKNPSEGRYECFCPPGYDLYEQVNQFGIDTKDKEDGTEPWHVISINHTCIRKRCNYSELHQPKAVENLKIFGIAAKTYDYGDSVTYLCNIGYKRKTGDFKYTCDINGDWLPKTPTKPECEKATCTFNKNDYKNPPTHTYAQNTFNYDEKTVLSFRCVTPLGKVEDRKVKCVYDKNQQNYALTGDSLECGVIDCGKPSRNLLSGVDGVPSNTTYKAEFIVECKNNSNPSGAGPITGRPNVAICTQEGKWDFGNLLCQSAKCKGSDVLHPDEGKTHVTSFEDGAEATFTCNRKGFAPTPPEPLVCNQGQWNGTVPKCVDVEPPKFVNCKNEQPLPVTLKQNLLNLPFPNVTDNSGAVARIVPEGVNLSQPYNTNEDTPLTWFAYDHAGNVANCTVVIRVKKNAQRTVKCNGESFTVDKKNFGITYTVVGGSITGGKSADDKYEPTTQNIRFSSIGKFLQSIYTGTADDGSRLSCTVFNHVRAKKCIPTFINQPNFARGNIISEWKEGPGFEIHFRCQDNRYFYREISGSVGSFETVKEFKFRCRNDQDYFELRSNSQTPQVKSPSNTLVPIIHDCSEVTGIRYFLSGYFLYSLQRVGGINFISTECRSKFFNYFDLNVKSANFRNQLLQSSVCSGRTMSIEQLELQLETLSSIRVIVKVAIGPNTININDLENCVSQVESIFKNFAGYGDTPEISGCSKLLRQKNGINFVRNLQSGRYCQDGYQIVKLSINNKDVYRCLICPSGYMHNKETRKCDKCSIGTYQPSPGTAQCLKCPTGKSTYFEGAFNKDDHCFDQCPPGYIGASNGLPPCTACKTDTFYNSTTMSCTQCPGGTSTNGITGVKDVNGCKNKCKPGTFSSNGFEPCIKCPFGTYVSTEGATICEDCYAANTTEFEGAISSDNCSEISNCDTDKKFCNNRGKCEVVGKAKVCTCDAGYTGRFCEVDIDDCASGPCLHGSACKDLVNSYQCTCRQRNRITVKKVTDTAISSGDVFASKSVNRVTAEDECQKICKLESRCFRAVLDFGIYSCFMLTKSSTTRKEVGKFIFQKEENTEDAYSNKTTCGEEINDCASSELNVCASTGGCLDLDPNFNNNELIQCVCDRGYTGEKCDRTITDICSTKPCLNGATCKAVRLGGTDIRRICQCKDGFSGDDCGTNINDCSPNPCFNGGTCIDKVNGFSCKCPSFTTGSKCENLRTDICSKNDCKASKSECRFDYPNAQMKCLCPDGYRDEYFWTRWFNADTNQKDGDDVEQVDRHISRYGSAVCERNKKSIMGMECRIRGSKIAHNDTANKDSLTYDCTNITLGLLCENKNQTDNKTCEDYEVRYQCSYRTLNKYYCHDINQCIEDEPCVNMRSSSSCFNDKHPLDYSCGCKSGFEGFNCQHNIDNCKTNPCKNGGICIDGINDYTCNCTFGWSGKNCENTKDNCNPNPCVNGRCNNKFGGFDCECFSGYEGLNCSKEINACDSKPCYNGGTCTNSGRGAFTCKCGPHFEGQKCERIKSTCNHNNCLKKSACFSVTQNDYYCACNQGTFGRHCDQGRDICEIANPCKNNGRCYVKDGTIKCECNENYVGDFCHIERDFCKQGNTICQNGATCSRKPDGKKYECSCPVGFRGDKCEENINDCALIKCGLGKCIDGINEGFCKCPPGKMGPSCARNIDRDFDIYFGRESKDSAAVTFFPFQMGSYGFTFSLWLRYAKEKDTGNFFTAYQVRSETSLDILDGFHLKMDERSVYLRMKNESSSKVAEVSANFTDLVVLNDGKWHSVIVLWSSDDGELTVRIDTIRVVFQVNFAKTFIVSDYLMARIGDSFNTKTQKSVPNEGFMGYISLVLLYNDFMKDYIELFINPNKILDQNSIVKDWDLYKIQSGASKQLISTRGKNTCSEGLIIKNGICVNKTLDKEPPSFENCPEMQVSNNGKRFGVVKWTSPTVKGTTNALVKNYESGLAFGFGATEVIYVATDDELNRAKCEFTIWVRPNDCRAPAVPDKGKIVYARDELYAYAKLQCDKGYHPLIETPNYYTCGPTGTWDSTRPYESFRFPQCSGTKNPDYKSIIKYGYHLNGKLCKDNIKAILEKKAKEGFEKKAQTDQNQPDTYWCKNSKCTFLFEVDCKDEQKPLITVTITDLSDPTGEENMITQMVLQTDFFNEDSVPGAEKIDASRFNFKLEYSCPDDYQVSGNLCVKCTKGTVFNDKTRVCDFCSIGYYSEDPTKDECDKCDSGFTTENIGARDKSECISKLLNFCVIKYTNPNIIQIIFLIEICKVGEMFDKNKKDCVLCEEGFYQEDKGKTYCKPCPFGTNNRRNGSNTEKHCTTACPGGQQLGEGGNCVNCPFGFYSRAEVDNRCISCPAGKTTASTGSDSSSDCCRIKCNAGQKRINDGCKGQTDSCVDCPQGTYRSLNFSHDVNCTACDPGYNTTIRAATDVKYCNFSCPAGKYISDGKCLNCPKGTYKDDLDFMSPFMTECHSCGEKTNFARNQTLGEGSSSIQDCRETDCHSGQYWDPAGGKCEDCDFDTYQTSNQVLVSTQCVSCGALRGTKRKGANSSEECINFCDSGQYFKDNETSTCSRCPIGTFKDNNVNDIAKQTIRFAYKCQDCPEGYTSENEGARSREECNLYKCTPGHYSTKSDTCIPCKKGSYLNTPARKCKDCPGFFTTERTASKTVKDCNQAVVFNVFRINLRFVDFTYNTSIFNPLSTQYQTIYGALLTAFQTSLTFKFQIYIWGFQRGSAVVIADIGADNAVNKKDSLSKIQSTLDNVVARGNIGDLAVTNPPTGRTVVDLSAVVDKDKCNQPGYQIVSNKTTGEAKCEKCNYNQFATEDSDICFSCPEYTSTKDLGTLLPTRSTSSNFKSMIDAACIKYCKLEKEKPDVLRVLLGSDMVPYCKNGGTCNDERAVRNCKCNGPYTGSRCEHRKLNDNNFTRDIGLGVGLGGGFLVIGLVVLVIIMYKRRNKPKKIKDDKKPIRNAENGKGLQGNAASAQIAAPISAMSPSQPVTKSPSRPPRKDKNKDKKRIPSKSPRRNGAAATTAATMTGVPGTSNFYNTDEGYYPYGIGQGPQAAGTLGVQRPIAGSVVNSQTGSQFMFYEEKEDDYNYDYSQGYNTGDGQYYGQQEFYDTQGYNY